MGVPKFFRWCAERYPSVITPFEDAAPPVDNLYLDMNGIIHHCSHPNDIDATQKAPTEKAMMQAMFTYLEKLFGAIQPRKYFVLAVDGVAPRAKMNQQRQRRYRSAYELFLAREAAIAEGVDVPEEKDVFDSNCITPGTPFMVRVSKEFQYFLTMKLATDPAWQTCQIIFSGHDCPGEGEHKLMEFMRRRKMQPGYDANETHCMYGLDADLIMLALATHEPHFILLREVVTFGPSSWKERARQEANEAKGVVQDKAYHKDDEFVLFHIGVLRDYLKIEIRSKLQDAGAAQTFDLERVIDDFIFMCFFVGNDFLPSIPTIAINEGGILTMLNLYVDEVLSRGYFLVDKGGKVNWRVTETWLASLGRLELSTLQQRQKDEANYQRNRARRDPDHEVPVNVDVAIESMAEYKEKFYREKHGFAKGWNPSGPEMQRMVLHYIEGLTWVLGYYYHGVQSWQWYYPHYYAPMASDLANLAAVAAKVSFTLGKPFLPHQQLLSVLPPMSYRLIPKAYWPLMRSQSSPLAKYFPEHLVIDREGARAEWEGIVLIPFINEAELLAAYESVQRDVTAEDAQNNRLGPALRFIYDEKATPTTLQDDMFGDLHHVLVRREPYELPPYIPFVPKLCPGVMTGDSQLEGFSSLQSKRLLLTPSFEVGEVTIFGGATRKESLILRLADFTPAGSAEAVKSLLGKEVLVGFPHYKRARVAMLSDVRQTLRATYTKDGVFSGVSTRAKNRDEAENFLREAETHRRYMKAKLGIRVEQVDLLVYVHRFSVMRLTAKGQLVRQFMTSETCYPIQLLCPLEIIRMRMDSRYEERERAAGDAAPGARCVFIGPEPKSGAAGHDAPVQLYGACGVVREVREGPAGRRLNTLLLKIYTAPLTLPASLTRFAARENWVTLHEVADRLGLRGATLSTICGSLETSPQFGSREIGLCIKFTGQCLARVGYAKLVQRTRNAWYTGVDFFARMERDAEDIAHHLAHTTKDDYLGQSKPMQRDAMSANNNNTTTSASSNTMNNSRNNGIWYFSLDAVRLVRDYVEAFRPLVDYMNGGGVDSRQVEVQHALTGPWSERAAEDVIDEMEQFIARSGIMKVSMINAAEEALPLAQLRELEDAVAAAQPRPTKEVQLRQVPKSQIYLPVTRSAGGHLIPLRLPIEQSFYLGARVVNCRATGAVPFGACGTIIRLLASGREAEVMYDVPFAGGQRFDGRLRETRGAITKFATLLVLPMKDAGSEAAAVQRQHEVKRGAGELDPTALLASMETDKLAGVLPSEPHRNVLPNPTNINHNSNNNAASSTNESSSSGGGVHLPVTAAAAARVASPGTVLNITASGPHGGVRLNDLVSKLPPGRQAATTSTSTTAAANSASAAAGGVRVTSSLAAASSLTSPSATTSATLSTTTTMASTTVAEPNRGHTPAMGGSSNKSNSNNSTHETRAKGRDGAPAAAPAASSSPPPALPPSQASSTSPHASAAARKRSSRLIPEDFLTGRVRVSHLDAAATFKKWQEALTAKELATIAKEMN